MNTDIKTIKTLYIARPKKTENVSNVDQEIIYANKLTGKPYIAYPKNGNYKPQPVAEKIELQEGLYIAYPRQEEASEEGTNTFSRLYISDNYMGLPEKPGGSAKKCYSLCDYSSFFKNRWSINTFCQLFKAKVS